MTSPSASTTRVRIDSLTFLFEGFDLCIEAYQMFVEDDKIGGCARLKVKYTFINLYTYELGTSVL